MRVSIVAALDGQQPESKSVINMVHRIQNRNHSLPRCFAFSKNNVIIAVEALSKALVELTLCG